MDEGSDRACSEGGCLSSLDLERARGEAIDSEAYQDDGEREARGECEAYLGSEAKARWAGPLGHEASISRRERWPLGVGHTRPLASLYARTMRIRP